MLPRVLALERSSDIVPVTMIEATFRWEMNADAMATEKLAEGIRGFDIDHKKLIEIIAARM